MKTHRPSLKIKYAATLSALFLAFSGAPAQAAKVPATYNFSGTTLTGTAFDGSVLAGKPTVMWFWAPWCTICRAESPNLVALAKTFKNKVNVVGVAGLANLEDMKAFVSDTKTGNFRHLADVDGQVWSYFGVVTQPTFVFISSKGERYTRVGAMQKADLFASTKKLIKGKAI